MAKYAWPADDAKALN